MSIGADVVQALVRQDGDRFVAESIEFPLRHDAATLDEALAGIEESIRKHIRAQTGVEPRFMMVVSLYFGNIVGQEIQSA